MVRNDRISLLEESFHPPALDAGRDGDEGEEIPSVLLEYKAYVADHRNNTTALAYSRCGREIQVTLFAARPPRVSYICVFCRPGPAEEVIAMEPNVVATDDDLLLLRIVVSPHKDLTYGSDYYIYRPASDDEPSLTRLPLPPDDRFLGPKNIGILSCPANRHADDDGSTGLSLLRPHRAPQDKFFMVAALEDDRSALAIGRFVLYPYNSKVQSWSVANVSLEAQHRQKYQDDGYFMHRNTRTIAVGGQDATIAFVDLWHRQYRNRDIAVIEGHFKFVRNLILRKNCPTCCSSDLVAGWESDVWTRPVSASSLLDDSWQPVCEMNSSGMDVKSSLDFQLLPKPVDNEQPFLTLNVAHPTLSWLNDHTVWFMVKIGQFDAKAWVIAVDVVNNRLQGVADFDAERYTAIGFAYLHSRISKYLKKAPGNFIFVPL
ncbi:hypothetical protein HU200_056542 [Digitaria exilis]|uniref:DUF1618 domain-containing protein n=1 Tax=Digitaria exilis TaxID=1010633 RepID=A0A835ACV2_9POAL|nr:hypothetical protein HU200_056542 [Digitaria exilis]